MQSNNPQLLSGGDRVARARTALFSALLAAAILTSACANGSGEGLSLASGSGVTGYVQASGFSRIGHKVSGLDGGRVRVTATGSSSTPRARVEKIALARAAEYGSQQKHRYFQATPAAGAVECGPRYVVRKGEKVELPKTGYVVATVDVTYAKTATDATFLPTKDTAERLKAELASDPALSAPAATDPEIASRC